MIFLVPTTLLSLSQKFNVSRWSSLLYFRGSKLSPIRRHASKEASARTAIIEEAPMHSYGSTKEWSRATSSACSSRRSAPSMEMSRSSTTTHKLHRMTHAAAQSAKVGHTPHNDVVLPPTPTARVARPWVAASAARPYVGRRLYTRIWPQVGRVRIKILPFTRRLFHIVFFGLAHIT